MRLLFLFLLFFTTKIYIYAEFFLINHLEHNLRDKPQIHYYYLIKNQIKEYSNFNFLLYYNNKKVSSLNLYLDFYHDVIIWELLLGEFFLHPLWNDLNFLREDFSNVLDFPEKRFYKGLYLSFFLNNFYYKYFYGFFYLEDHSRGIFFYNLNKFILYDFYNKKYAYYHKIKTNKFFYYSNIAGEKKDVYGFFSLKINNLYNNNYLDFFIIRNNFWDAYDYYTDQYDLEKKYKKSHFANLQTYYKIIQMDINYFLKGNIIFNKNNLTIDIFSNHFLKFLIGYNYYESIVEKKYKKNYYMYNLRFIFNHNLTYIFDYEFNRNQYIFYFKTNSLIKKQRFFLGVYYSNFNIKNLSYQFYFINIEIEETYKKSYLLDRSYSGVIIEYLIQTEKINFFINYLYNIKFISSKKLDIHSIQTKFSFKF